MNNTAKGGLTRREKVSLVFKDWAYVNRDRTYRPVIELFNLMRFNVLYTDLLNTNEEELFCPVVRDRIHSGCARITALVYGSANALMYTRRKVWNDYSANFNSRQGWNVCQYFDLKMNEN